MRAQPSSTAQLGFMMDCAEQASLRSSAWIGRLMLHMVFSLADGELIELWGCYGAWPGLGVRLLPRVSQELR